MTKRHNNYMCFILNSTINNIESYVYYTFNCNRIYDKSLDCINLSNPQRQINRSFNLCDFGSRTELHKYTFAMNAFNHHVIIATIKIDGFLYI